MGVIRNRRSVTQRDPAKPPLMTVDAIDLAVPSANKILIELVGVGVGLTINGVPQFQLDGPWGIAFPVAVTWDVDAGEYVVEYGFAVALAESIQIAAWDPATRNAAGGWIAPFVRSLI